MAASSRDILSLTDYAVAIRENGIEPGEKVVAFGTRNLLGSDLRDWQTQMLATCAVAPRVTNPLVHIVISLAEGETWQERERQETIDIVLRTLGVEHCPVEWSEHGNTTNPHLHLAVLRIDPATGAAAGSEWLIDDLHQALAIIEEQHGREREPNALYVAREGAVYDATTGLLVRNKKGEYQAGWYKEAGRKRTRVPHQLERHRAALLQIAREAQSWSEFHGQLSELAIAYDRVGSGAHVILGDTSIKASALHQSLSRTQLEQRLGVFEPDLARLEPEYEQFKSALDTDLARLRQERDDQRRRLERWTADLSAKLASRSKLFLSALTAEKAEAQAALSAAYAAAIQNCTRQRLKRDEWISAGRPRYQIVESPLVLLPEQIDERATVAFRPELTEVVVGWASEYRDESGRALLTDHRTIIIVHKTEDDRALEQALRLAGGRWGTVRYRGPESQMARVAERAAMLGVQVVDLAGRPLHEALKATEQRAPAPDPSGKIAPDQPRRYVAPQPDQDPARRAAVDAAIETLRRFPGLPLRRAEITKQDDKTERTGPLEVVLDEEFAPRLKNASFLDQDPKVQGFLEEYRADMLASVESDLTMFVRVRVPQIKEELLQALPNVASLQRSVAFAYDDFDFQLMLQRVREKMMERERQPVQRVSYGLELNARERQRSAERQEEKGYSITDLQAQYRAGRVRAR